MTFIQFNSFLIIPYIFALPEKQDNSLVYMHLTEQLNEVKMHENPNIHNIYDNIDAYHSTHWGESKVNHHASPHVRLGFAIIIIL